MKLNFKDFYILGLEIINKVKYDKTHTPTANQEREFRSQFGASWYVCADVWNLLDMHEIGLESKKEPKHLLWAMLFLKVYGNEKTHAVMCSTSVKTFRKWVWDMISQISQLEIVVVSFDDFFSFQNVSEYEFSFLRWVPIFLTRLTGTEGSSKILGMTV